MESMASLVVSADQEPAEQLKQMLNQAEVSPRIVVRRNLDGDAATWIVMATLSAQMLPSLLTFLETIVGGRRVKKIKLGDLEIENPSSQDLKEFRRMMRRLSEDPKVESSQPEESE
jgi:hypothetical protein